MWECFPPTRADALRLEEHDKLLKLYQGEYKRILERWDAIKIKRPESPQISINFFKVVSDEFAKMIFGESPVVSVPDQYKNIMDGIFHDTNLQAKMYQAAAMASVQGGGILKAWKSGDGAVHIDTVQDAIYFPTFDPDDATRVTGVTLAWEREDEDTDIVYLVREMYRPGEWMRDVIDMTAWRRDEERLELWYPDAPKDWTPTGHDGIPVEYVPNCQRVGEFWGDSDYCAMRDIAEEIMVRFSMLADVLNKHAYPKIVVPSELTEKMQSAAREDLARNDGFPRGLVDVVSGLGKNDLSALVDIFGTDPDTDKGMLPRYVTWDASLASAYQELDKAFEFLLMITCLPPEAFGLAKYGISESGRALKFRNTRALAETNKKRLFMLPPIKRVIRAALAFAGAQVDLSDISIATEDGLPFDPIDATAVAVQQRAAGIVSLQTAIRMINPDLSNDGIEEESQRIAAESIMAQMEAMGGFPGFPTEAVNPSNGGNSETA
jgi:hypothetical protein